jgi:hypothetical protein
MNETPTPQWSVNPGPAWEKGCGPADPALSAAQASYTGTGYGVRGGTGEVGTINAGANTPVALAGFPAQVRFFIGADGQLHALTNQTGLDFVATSAPQTPAQQPPVYSPTK